jgi:hypothetical protein
MNKITTVAWGIALLSWLTACLPRSLPMIATVTVNARPTVIPTVTVNAIPTVIPTTMVTVTQNTIPNVVALNPDSFPIFGAEMEHLTSAGGLDQMASANISWARRNGVLWSSVETTEGTYNWGALASLESELQNASNKGIQVILIVRSTPEWARKIAGSGPYCGPIHPDKLVAFGNFMHELVGRYSVAPYNVKNWELWNEPDVDPSYFGYGDSVFGCWGDLSDEYYGGRYYAEMLKEAYPQIKAADPQAQVLVGGLLLDCDPRGSPSVCASLDPPHNDKQPKFLEGILLGGGGPYFDGVSFHNYDFYWGALGQYKMPNWVSAWNKTGPTVIAKAGFVSSVLTSYGYSDKFLMNTETALLCDSCGDDTTYETTKAYYVARTYAVALAKGLRANVWYSVFGWRNSGLLNPDLSPRPAYTALQFSRSELRDANWVRDITEYAGVKGYEFQRGDRRIWVLWSLDGNMHLINLPGVPLVISHVDGTPISPVRTLTVTLEPQYFEIVL